MGNLLGTSTVTCPICNAALLVEVEQKGSHYTTDGVFTVLIGVKSITGCAHAEDWMNRPPDGDGGLPIRLKEAA